MTPQAQVTALLCCALGDAVSPLTAAQAKQVLLRLERAGVRERTDERPQITKTDLFLCGLSGGAGSARRRAELMRRLELPEHLGANAFLDALNLLMTREALFREYNIQP